MHASHKMVVATGTMALLIAVVGFGVWYQFFRDDAPPRVSLAAALESIETTAGTTDTIVDRRCQAPGSMASGRRQRNRFIRRIPNR